MRGHRDATGLALAAAALAWMAGAAGQLQQAALWPVAGYAGVAAAGLLALAVAWRQRRGRWRAMLPAAALGLACIAFAQTGLRASATLDDALPAALEGRDIVVTGVVSQLPRRLADGTRFRFQVQSTAWPPGSSERAAPQVPATVTLGWYRGWHDEAWIDSPLDELRAGQRWRFTVRLKQPHGSSNPHGFDVELWLFEQGIRATGYVRATATRPAERLDDRAAYPIERARQALRDAIDARVPDPRAAGVLAALAVGDQAAIERADWDLFRTTGIAHLMSISGLHVTMFAWLTGAGVGALWRRSERATLWLPVPTAARWGGVLAAALYALLAGWGVPSQRTVWMLATAALLATLGLRWPWLLVLAMAGAVVVAIDPWALLQPGFWLSFVAVGVLMASQPVSESARSAPSGPWSRGVAALRAGVRTQVTATLGLAPLSMVFFGQVSLVGFVANLIAIPLVTLLITPLALLGALLPPLWTAGAWLVQGLSTGLGWLAAWPGALWSVAVAPLWAQAAGLVAGVLLVLPLPWRLRAMALPLALPLLWPPIERPAEGQMQVVAADVGQGSAVLVRTRNHLLLHDAGPQYSRDSDAGTRVLLPLLRARGEPGIDLLVLSHRDSDHVGGAAALFAQMPIARWTSSLDASHPLRAGTVPHTRCEAGQRWMWDGVRFEMLHPHRADFSRENAKPNSMSCVLRVSDASGAAVLLTGDIEAAQEGALVGAAGAALQSEVLLVPHHGSRTSSSAAFLDAVAPRVAVVQAGYRNRFGHPAPDVAARYDERGIALVRSDRCGAWTWDDGTVWCWRDRARRYWHHLPADGAQLASPAGTQ